MPEQIPKLIEYWGGLFRLKQENLPDEVKKNKDLQNKVLILVRHKFANYPWGSMLPEQRMEEVNNYVYELLESYFEE